MMSPFRSLLWTAGPGGSPLPVQSNVSDSEIVHGRPTDRRSTGTLYFVRLTRWADHLKHPPVSNGAPDDDRGAATLRRGPSTVSLKATRLPPASGRNSMVTLADRITDSSVLAVLWRAFAYFALRRGVGAVEAATHSGHRSPGQASTETAGNRSRMRATSGMTRTSPKLRASGAANPVPGWGSRRLAATRIESHRLDCRCASTECRGRFYMACPRPVIRAGLTPGSCNRCRGHREPGAAQRDFSLPMHGLQCRVAEERAWQQAGDETE
jgi:hypothetical protein